MYSIAIQTQYMYCTFAETHELVHGGGVTDLEAVAEERVLQLVHLLVVGLAGHLREPVGLRERVFGAQVEPRR